MTTRGFVTIATGKENYYVIAANLLASYRHFSKEPMPFALICDVENEYSAQFDDVILMDNPHYSYLDKLTLPHYAPYDETIFIDSDCLAYRDLNDFWDYFEGATDFSAFGRNYSINHRNGWFEKDKVGDYGSKIHLIPEFIGGVYFIRKTKELEEFEKTVADVWENYYLYEFRQFVDPCDEPIFALSMAVHNFKATDDTQAPICFYPKTIDFKADINTSTVIYSISFEKGSPLHTGAYMIHWGSGNTHYQPYTVEVNKLYHLNGSQRRIKTALNNTRIMASYHGRNFIRAFLSKIHLLEKARKVRDSFMKKGEIRR